MPAAYPLTLRQRAVDLYKEGNHTQSEVAVIYQLGLTTFRDYLRRDKAGKLAPTNYSPGRKTKIGERQKNQIAQWIKKNPSLTLSELCHKYVKHYKIKVSQSMMWRACDQLNLSYKKKTIHASEKNRPDVKKKRKTFSKPLKKLTQRT